MVVGKHKASMRPVPVGDRGGGATGDEGARVEAMILVERLKDALAQALLTVGPDAPTLCEGWTAAALAAHLYVRENRPTKAVGILIPQLANRLEMEMAKVKGQDLAFVVDAWRKGKVSKLPKVVQQKMNTLEYFVHYVDVVAANPDKFAETAVLRLHDNDRLELMAHARSMAAMLLRGSAGPVIFEPVGGKRVVVHDRLGVAVQGDRVAVVRGSAENMVLWLFGRAASYGDGAGVVVEDPYGLLRLSPV